MAKTVIRVENLGKLYKLGEVGTGTISHDLNRWWAKMRGKEDPFAIIGEANDRTTKGSSDYVWALKDVSFEVKQGEVLGVIGRNGAGKSTLLKVLSKVTSPSTGKIKVKGRIASLLEVGTGFHPELTGRENIFLNGAILGMTKAEIRSKFDEIVDFAGVERYIDTPVKRYSSGMYVRLAFAVAAFLEPEILIVDEVLAVGDAEFQKKCLGRMKDVSTHEGRTILFVSHNMGAIKSLCNNVLIMQHGSVNFRGNVNSGIERYLDIDSKTRSASYCAPVADKEATYFKSIDILGADGLHKQEFGFDEEINIECMLNVLSRHLAAKVSIRAVDRLERIVFTSESDIKAHTSTAGVLKLGVKIPAQVLVPSSYRLQFAIHIPNLELVEVLPDILQFGVLDTGTDFYMYGDHDYGCVFVNCKWNTLN